MAGDRYLAVPCLYTDTRRLRKRYMAGDGYVA